jgi:glycosyltransferase involved in cell wall biosynthesis
VVPVYNEAHVLADSVGRLHAYLEASFPFPFRITVADNASTDATWLVAVAADQTASSIILESGEPVISTGGWSGSDNAMTLARLKSLVQSGKLHYIVISSTGGQGTNSEIATWVAEHGTAVKSSAYSASSSSPSSATSSSSNGGLYRLDASDVS